jgi:hypothetical protein
MPRPSGWSARATIIELTMLRGNSANRTPSVPPISPSSFAVPRVLLASITTSTLVAATQLD